MWDTIWTQCFTWRDALTGPRLPCPPLSQIPAVNGVIDGDEIVYRDYCDISIAVATPKGLVVPVLRSADKLTMAEVEKVRPRAGAGGGGGNCDCH